MHTAETLTSLQDALTRIEWLLKSYTGEQNSKRVEALEVAPVTAEMAESLSQDSGTTCDQFSRRFAILVDRFDLSPAQQDAILLALAPDLKTQFSRSFARIHDDTSLRRPTVDVLTAILKAAGRSETEALGVFVPSSPLVEWQLLDLRTRGTDIPFHARIVGVEQRILMYLLGDDELDPALATAVTVTECQWEIKDLPVSKQTRTKLEKLPHDPTTRPMVYYFAGPDKKVRSRAVEASCSQSDSPVVQGSLLAVTDTEERLKRTLREAILRNGAVHLTMSEMLKEETTENKTSPETDRISINEFITEAAAFPGNIYLTGETVWTPDCPVENHEFALLEFPDPGYELRRELWAQRSERLPDDVSPTDLAGTFELTQGQIDSALATADALSHSEEGADITREALYEGCKSQSSANLESLAEPISPGYRWEDIKLPSGTEKQLREVATHITNRGTVYSEWGFEQKFSRGIGVVALFSGPSGTGKTMAAEVLANDAGLDLYRVDLSTVVSKYIGETEENLEEIFDEAEQSSAILLFDEADAIFGERSEVSDSTDRYANAEVNYLLQRIENHDGVVLLTTNYESNIDSAFRRRIHLHVEFNRPDEEIRRQLWQELFPDETPTEDLDYEFLAEIELAGGEIRNAAQTAAFRAAGENSPVRMEHVIPAVRREREKTGALVDPKAFGEYREYLTY